MVCPSFVETDFARSGLGGDGESQVSRCRLPYQNRRGIWIPVERMFGARQFFPGISVSVR